MHRHCHDSKTALDNKTYPKFKLQYQAENYIWIDDMLTRFAGLSDEKGRLREEPDEVKVSSPVLLTRRFGNLPGLV